ncbi:MAG: DnaJ domain-containing protein [Myxococcales bacterium]|nr:DnaJ domain-containing protein [Myxococcales bacterium]
MSDKDFYATLGVSRSASADEIKSAYRKLARELHPDRNPGDAKAEERFKAVAEAYGVLSDAKKKGLYDEFGVIGLREGFDPDVARQRESYGGFDGFGGGGGFGGFEGFGFDISDILRQARGAGAGAGAARPRDLEASLELDIVEALQGGERELVLGSDGRRVKVRIPSGVRDGAKLRIRGQGAASRRGGRGDLVLTMHVRDRAELWFEEDGLHLRVPIRPLEAFEGAKVSVSTPEGSVTVRVPPGSRSGQKMRLKGKGAKERGGKAGDLFVHLDVQWPASGGDEVRAAVATLDAQVAGDVRAGLPKLD